jgi:hypothetical protein
MKAIALAGFTIAAVTVAPHAAACGLLDARVHQYAKYAFCATRSARAYSGGRRCRPVSDDSVAELEVGLGEVVPDGQ